MKGFLTVLSAAVAFLILGFMVLTIKSIDIGGNSAIASERVSAGLTPGITSVRTTECPDTVNAAEGSAKDPVDIGTSEEIEKVTDTVTSDILKTIKLPEDLKIKDTGKTCK